MGDMVTRGTIAHWRTLCVQQNNLVLAWIDANEPILNDDVVSVEDRIKYFKATDALNEFREEHAGLAWNFILEVLDEVERRADEIEMLQRKLKDLEPLVAAEIEEQGGE